MYSLAKNTHIIMKSLHFENINNKGSKKVKTIWLSKSIFKVNFQSQFSKSIFRLKKHPNLSKLLHLGISFIIGNICKFNFWPTLFCNLWHQVLSKWHYVFTKYNKFYFIPWFLANYQTNFNPLNWIFITKLTLLYISRPGR